MLIENNDVVLFQGDSITDADRYYDQKDNLGQGYALMASSWFEAKYPEKTITFLNRGISGNRVKDLRSRWQSDCLDHQPDLISILIGINDCWRRYDSNDPTSAEMFEQDYRDILQQVKNQLQAKIVLLEPFMLPYPEDRKKWREDLDPKISVVRKLAKEFNAEFISLDEEFAKVSTLREPSFWAHDGVHPTPAGHALIAQNWLSKIESDH